MKYVFTGGPWREFRGHVFANGKPVTIMDAATLEAVKRDPEFKEYQEPQELPPLPKLPPPPEYARREILRARRR